jgi:hypothetical protein
MAPSVTFRTALAASAFVLLSACAQGATARGMTITPADLRAPPNPGLVQSVTVTGVAGGKETNPMWKSNIGDAAFREALEESLRAVAFLSQPGTAPLALEARLVRVDQPFAGFNMTVTSVVHYTIKEVRSGAVLIDEDVEAQHTATVGDAFVGTTRLQLANEGSARKNIAALIERMNKIQVGVAPAAAPSM